MDNTQIPGADLSSDSADNNASYTSLAVVSPAQAVQLNTQDASQVFITDNFTSYYNSVGDLSGELQCPFIHDPGEFLAVWGFDFDPEMTFGNGQATSANGTLFYLTPNLYGNHDETPFTCIQGYVIQGVFLLDVTFQMPDGSSRTATLVPDTSPLWSPSRYDMGLWWQNDGKRIKLTPFVNISNPGQGVQELTWSFTRSHGVGEIGVGTKILAGSQFLAATNELNSLALPLAGNYPQYMMSWGSPSDLGSNNQLPALPIAPWYMGLAVKRNDNVGLDVIASLFPAAFTEN